MLILLASSKYVWYRSISLCCPLKAYTVRIADRTSSATDPARPIATASIFDSLDAIYDKVLQFIVNICFKIKSSKKIKKYLTKPAIPTNPSVTGNVIKHKSANFHPFTRAIMIELKNAAW